MKCIATVFARTYITFAIATGASLYGVKVSMLVQSNLPGAFWSGMVLMVFGYAGGGWMLIALLRFNRRMRQTAVVMRLLGHAPRNHWCAVLELSCRSCSACVLHYPTGKLMVYRAYERCPRSLD